MALILDQSNIFNLTHLVGYTGQTSGSRNTSDLSSFFITTSVVPTPKIVQVDTTDNITTGFNTYYKMEGYNSATQQYENWHSMGTPLLSPPSGNALTNISIVYTWQDR